MTLARVPWSSRQFTIIEVAFSRISLKRHLTAFFLLFDGLNDDKRCVNETFGALARFVECVCN